MITGDESGGDDPVLAKSTLCTVTRLEDGETIELQIGAAVVRLSARDLASLTGTLRRVVRRVFPHEYEQEKQQHEHRIMPAHLHVIDGGKP
jgi:hypothetical protein